MLAQRPFRNAIDFSGVPNASEGTNLATGVGSSVIIRTELPGNVFRARFDVATGVLLGNELTRSAQGTTMSVGLRQLA